MNIYPFFAPIHCHLVNFIFSLAPLWPLGNDVVPEVTSRKELPIGKQGGNQMMLTAFSILSG